MLPIMDPDELEVVEKPELIFGFVAAVGTPLPYVCRILKEELSHRGYLCEELHLSNYLEGLQPESNLQGSESSEYNRINKLMDWGNELRETTGGGEALALLAVSYINNKRPQKDPPHLSGHAFVLRQLKHPDEVYWLRKIYGPAFHLIGVYCSDATRKDHLIVQNGMTEKEAKTLIARDLGEKKQFGQQLRDTFYLADVFVEFSQNDTSGEQVATQLRRYLKLLFAEEVVTPTINEYGMHLAYTASLRSADLSRQVGAAILSDKREVIALGANEVPAPDGGQYWEDDSKDARDFKQGKDYNAVISRDILRELFTRLFDGYLDLSEEEQEWLLEEASQKLVSTRIMSLTEFGRAVHAEMEAILAAGRIGVTVRGFDLYTTTFPCHNCAKHIVAAGIKKVVYIEPYPKSLAQTLHEDAILFSEDENDERKTVFEPFVGVAPRIYPVLFSMQTPDGRRLKRKTKTGKLICVPLGLRVSASPLTYIDRESAAAIAIDKIARMTRRGDDNESHIKK